MNFGFDLETIKVVITRKFLPKDAELVCYKVVQKKQEERRSNWDSSKHLLIFYEKGGGLYRMQLSHNNNQHLKIDDPKAWAKPGHEELLKEQPKSVDPTLHWSKQ